MEMNLSTSGGSLEYSQNTQHFSLPEYHNRLLELHNQYIKTFLLDRGEDKFPSNLSKETEISNRVKRDMPSLHRSKKKKLRTCSNMNGILGGSNAFNYVSFIMAVLTLVVNVNNNINNNNNNVNQVGVNTGSNNNANANVNNNNANVVNVMPPGKKRRRKRVPSPFDVYLNRVCLHSQKSSVVGEVSLAGVTLLQYLLNTFRNTSVDYCMTGEHLCKALTESRRLGLGGRLLASVLQFLPYNYSGLKEEKFLQYCSNIEYECGVSSNSSAEILEPNFGDRLEENLVNQGDPLVETNERTSTDVYGVRCGLCGHKLADTTSSVHQQTPFSLSTIKMSGILGQNGKPVVIQEFENPAGVHFRSFNVNHATCRSDGAEWQGGNTWYPGYDWKICYCPICSQAVGWHWRSKSTDGNTVDDNIEASSNGKSSDDFYGLRVERVANFQTQFYGQFMNVINLFLD